MILFDDNIIEEFKKHVDVNPNNFGWWNFVNFKYDLDTALAFAKFYYPEIIEVESYFFLKDKFDQKLFEEWKEACNHNKEKVERIMNLYELKDFFHINQDKNDNLEEKWKVLGELLELFWGLSFKNQFPNKNIKIDIFDEDGNDYITIYEQFPNEG